MRWLGQSSIRRAAPDPRLTLTCNHDAKDTLPVAVFQRSIWLFRNVAGLPMARIFQFDEYANRILTGLTLAETRELEALERETPSLADWDAFTMQPVSEQEKRWAYLSQKHIDAMQRQTTQSAPVAGTSQQRSET